MRNARLRSRLLRTLVGAVGVAGLLGMAATVPARADDTLIKYNGNSRDYWDGSPTTHMSLSPLPTQWASDSLPALYDSLLRPILVSATAPTQ